VGFHDGPLNRLASYPRLTLRTLCFFSAVAVRLARTAIEARPSRGLLDRYGSPPPTRMIEPALGDTTKVSKRCSGPSRDSAAVEVSSFIVEAGMYPVVALCR
jgi:hypothetical protein